MKKQITDLPPSKDEFWEGSEVIENINKPIDLCSTHTKDNWYAHVGYIDNHDSSVSCKFCPWGTRIPGYMRLVNGKILDLRGINRS